MLLAIFVEEGTAASCARVAGGRHWQVAMVIDYARSRIDSFTKASSRLSGAVYDLSDWARVRPRRRDHA